MGRIVTLLYHRVREYLLDTQLLSVSPDNFYNQINWLKKNYHIVKFDDDWDSVKEDAICITFDDGYLDNFIQAVPILNELNVPATIFVSTGNIDTNNEMWWDELERNLLLERKYKKSFLLNDYIYEFEFPTCNYEWRKETYENLHWLMKYFIDVNQRGKWITQLQEWNNYAKGGRSENRIVTVDELKKTNLCNISIGAHTVNHPRLATLGYEEQCYEIRESIIFLESILKYKIDIFSYPFGGINDYDENTLKICRNLGIRKAAANFPGIWTKNIDCLQVPRNIVRDWNIEMFKNEIQNIWRNN